MLHKDNNLYWKYLLMTHTLLLLTLISMQCYAPLCHHSYQLEHCIHLQAADATSHQNCCSLSDSQDRAAEHHVKCGPSSQLQNKIIQIPLSTTDPTLISWYDCYHSTQGQQSTHLVSKTIKKSLKCRNVILSDNCH